jgi:hypothetical protein
MLSCLQLGAQISGPNRQKARRKGKPEQLKPDPPHLSCCCVHIHIQHVQYPPICCQTPLPLKPAHQLHTRPASAPAHVSSDMTCISVRTSPAAVSALTLSACPLSSVATVATTGMYPLFTRLRSSVGSTRVTSPTYLQAHSTNNELSASLVTKGCEGLCDASAQQRMADLTTQPADTQQRSVQHSGLSPCAAWHCRRAQLLFTKFTLLHRSVGSHQVTSSIILQESQIQNETALTGQFCRPFVST